MLSRKVPVAYRSQIPIENAGSDEKGLNAVRFTVMKVKYFLDPVGSVELRYDELCSSKTKSIFTVHIVRVLFCLQLIKSKAWITFLTHVVKS